MRVLLVDFGETISIEVDGGVLLKFSLFLVDSEKFKILVPHNIIEDYTMCKINPTYFIFVYFVCELVLDIFTK